MVTVSLDQFPEKKLGSMKNELTSLSKTDKSIKNAFSGFENATVECASVTGTDELSGKLVDDVKVSPVPADKMFVQDMFPYPSGDGLHVSDAGNLLLADATWEAVAPALGPS